MIVNFNNMRTHYLFLIFQMKMQTLCHSFYNRLMISFFSCEFSHSIFGNGLILCHLVSKIICSQSFPLIFLSEEFLVIFLSKADDAKRLLLGKLYSISFWK